MYVQNRDPGAADLKLPSSFRLILGGVALVAVLGLLIYKRVYGPSELASGGSAATGGKIVATIRAEPRSFNRFVSPQASVGVITLLTQSTLVRVNRVTGAIEPRLAIEWSASSDGLTWTMKL